MGKHTIKNNESSIDISETVVNNVVYLQPETYSFSPFFQNYHQHKSLSSKAKRLFSPEPSATVKRMQVHTSPKQKQKSKTVTYNLKQSFLSQFNFEDNVYYDINDISFFELGGNEE